MCVSLLCRTLFSLGRVGLDLTEMHPSQQQHRRHTHLDPRPVAPWPSSCTGRHIGGRIVCALGLGWDWLASLDEAKASLDALLRPFARRGRPLTPFRMLWCARESSSPAIPVSAIRRQSPGMRRSALCSSKWTRSICIFCLTHHQSIRSRLRSKAYRLPVRTPGLLTVCMYRYVCMYVHPALRSPGMKISRSNEKAERRPVPCMIFPFSRATFMHPPHLEAAEGPAVTV